jgi:hypothetical protein
MTWVDQGLWGRSALSLSKGMLVNTSSPPGTAQSITHRWMVKQRVNYEKCSKLDFLPPRFFSTSSHFFWAIFVHNWFNSGIICSEVPPVSLSLRRARSSTCRLHLAHGPQQRCHARALRDKAVADWAPVPLSTVLIWPPVSSSWRPVWSRRRLFASDRVCPSTPCPRFLGRCAHLPPVPVYCGCRPPHPSPFPCRSLPAAPPPLSTFLVAAPLLRAGEPHVTALAPTVVVTLCWIYRRLTPAQRSRSHRQCHHACVHGLLPEPL